MAAASVGSGARDYSYHALVVEHAQLSRHADGPRLAIPDRPGHVHRRTVTGRFYQYVHVDGLMGGRLSTLPEAPSLPDLGTG